jgi:hypothetical protein
MEVKIRVLPLSLPSIGNSPSQNPVSFGPWHNTSLHVTTHVVRLKAEEVKRPQLLI